MTDVMVVAGARTAIGDYGGAFKDVPATRLGAGPPRGRGGGGESDVRQAGARGGGRGALDAPRGATRLVSLARRGRGCGHPGRHAGADGESPLWLGSAGDRVRRAA